MALVRNILPCWGGAGEGTSGAWANSGWILKIVAISIIPISTFDL